MSQEYNEWLAAHVLNERQPVSFRSLSRALKIHSNLAKQILFDFHQRQNSKKPGSVHATYLITGTRIAPTPETQSQDDEDTTMHSDPAFPSSSMPAQDSSSPSTINTKSILIVKEQHLSSAQATFSHITGIHIYSLQPSNLSDLQSLTECNRQLLSQYSSEDPLKAWSQYGTIQNPHVQRRTGTRAVPAPTPAPAPPPTTTSAPSKTPNPSAPLARSQPRIASSKPASLKREDSSLFKSFAKSTPKAPKPAPAEEAAMPEFSSDSESEEVPPTLPSQISPDPALLSGKSRSQRTAELQAMMEQEDDEDERMEDVDGVGSDGKEGEEEEKVEEEEGGMVRVENGRRRGRRKVMKKKTVKDAEGYLVTREEPAWESFSEEEKPPPKKVKVEAPPKGGKAAAKVGQGNIMSFFGKRG